MTPPHQVAAVPCPRCGRAQTADGMSCAACGLARVCQTCREPYPDPLTDCFCVACGEPVATSVPAGEIRDSAVAVTRRRRGGAAAAAWDASSAHARQLAARAQPRDGDAADKRRAGLAAALAVSARRVLRRLKPGTVAERYLELGAALAREGRLDEAVDAFTHAMDEDERLRGEVLRDMFEAAVGVPDPELAVKTGLELVLAEPAQSAAVLRRAGSLLDRDAAAAHGDWILATFLPEIEQQGPAAVAAESALLAARVAIMRGDEEAAVELCERASACSPEVVRDRARLVLATAREERPWARDAVGSWALARLSAALDLVADALYDIDEVLAQGLPGPHPQAHLPVLELKAQLLEAREPEQAAATLVTLGRDLDLLARHDEAVTAFARAATLSPQNAEAWWYAADSRRMAARRDAWPHAEDDEIQTALRDWRRGLDVDRPGPTFAWVHLTGALLLESDACARDDRGDWIWSAALQVEQAIALQPDTADAWALAAHVHRMLGHPVTARLAADAAIARQRDYGPALAEQLDAHVAADTPALDDVLDAARAMPESQLRAMIASAARSLAHGHAHRAVDEYAAALAIEPGSVALHVGRAIAAALAGHPQQSSEDTADLSRWTDSEREWACSPELLEQRGLAALVEGDGDEAVATLSRLVGSHWIDQAQLCGELAAGELLRDDARAAAAQLDLLVARAGVALHGLYTRRLLELVQLRLGRKLAPDAWRRLAKAESRIAERPDGLAGVEHELEAARARDGIRFVVATAARARTLEEGGELDHAAELYERLLEYDDPLDGLPGASQALIRVLRAASAAAVGAGDAARVRGLQERLAGLSASDAATVAMAVSDAQLEAGDPDAAVRELEPLLVAPAEDAAGGPAEDAAGGPAEDAPGAPADASDDALEVDASRHRLYPLRLRHGDLLLQAGRHDDARRSYEIALASAGGHAGFEYEAAEAQTRLGVLAALGGDLAGAADALREALRRADGTPALRRVEAIVASCEDAVDGVDSPPGLGSVLRALTEDPTLGAPLRRDLRAARLAAIRRTPGRSSLPPLAALAMEFDDAAFPQGSAGAEARHLLGTALPALREDLRTATGVRTPRVVVRTSELLGPGRYRLLVCGVPCGSGLLAAGRFLCIDDPAWCEPRSNESPLVDPWDGAPGIWLTGDALEDARRRGLRLLDPFDAVVSHMRGLARVHLASLFGVADVRLAVAALRARGEHDAVDLAAVTDDVGRLVRLAAVARQLVREQVRVNDVAAIVAAMESCDDDDLATCVDRVRAALSRTLPDRVSARDRIELPADLEAAIADADPAGEHRQLRDACRELIGGRAPGSFVVVVDAPQRRRAVQRTFDRLLPTVAVATAGELLALRRDRRRRVRRGR